MKKSTEIRKVHFGAEELDSGKSIAVWRDSPNVIIAAVGFLKDLHRYRIEVNIPKSLAEIDGKDLFLNTSELGNVCNCVVENISTTPTGSLLVINVLAKGHELNEVLLVGSETKHTKIVLNGTILGSDMGTPLLKNGVHLIGKETEQFSDDD